MNARVSIIILNWNGLGDTSKTNKMVARIPENRAIMGTEMEPDTVTITQRKEALERELKRIVAHHQFSNSETPLLVVLPSTQYR